MYFVMQVLYTWVQSTYTDLCSHVQMQSELKMMLYVCMLYG